MSSVKASSDLILQWKNISIRNKKNGSPILSHLNGFVSSGQFLSIMGPSGAGKSSFLSLLTTQYSSFPSQFKISGSFLLNSQSYTQQQFISLSSYVPQDDLLLQTLTVEQTLRFQAKLKMWEMTKDQQEQRVEKVLKQFGLWELRSVRVGGKFTKTISGGQKKRLVIAVELLADPKILVLDEPTSGLDSSNSLKIIKILRNLAKQQNKLIIATIHQPSTLIFQNFDKLLVLNSGKQIYFDEANKIVQYMQRIGTKVDYRMNPADFFMLQISSYKAQKGHITLMTNQVFEKQTTSKKSRQQNKYVPTQVASFPSSQVSPCPLKMQYKPLLYRNLLNFIRNPATQTGRLMQMITFPLFLGIIYLIQKGLLYFDVLDRIDDIQNQQQLEVFLIKFAALILLGLFFSIAQTLYDTMLVFPSQQQLIMKEVRSNTYSLNLYFVTKLMVELPGVLIPTWISSTIVYFVVGLQPSVECYLFFELMFTLQSITGYLIGIICGVILKSPSLCIQAAPFVVMPLVLYGGLTVNLNTIPAYSAWVQYVTPLRYGYNSLLINQLNTNALRYIGQIDGVRDILGLSWDEKDNAIGLSLLGFGVAVLAFVGLYYRRKMG